MYLKPALDIGAYVYAPEPKRVNAFFDFFDLKLSVYSLENAMEDDGDILQSILDGEHTLLMVTTPHGTFNAVKGARDEDGWVDLVVDCGHEDDMLEVVRSLYGKTGKFA